MLLLGNCLEKLKELEDNSIDAIVTDPPYGLKFMNKHWDYDVPSVEIWKEVLRVLKPGGHLLSFGGTRTYHRMAVNIEDAGFEIRDQIQWLYGSGFPKSHNLKDEWQGWGSALKPANEPICMARKPLEKGLTIAENVSKWGCGALNIDESRTEKKPRTTHADGNVVTCESKTGHLRGKMPHGPTPAPEGRWPANVIFDEQAAELLDEQSGLLKSGSLLTHHKRNGKAPIGTFQIRDRTGEECNFGGDSGGASRFFYVAKASKSERNAGLKGMFLVKSGIKNDSGRGFSESDPHKIILNQNHHPTVKPIKLMQYLIKLITPPQGIVLDPFMGSGSTGVASKQLGFKFIGIELSPEYFEIAQKRIESANEV